VLAVDTMQQALDRSGGAKRHTGRDAARAVLTMAALREQLDHSPGPPRPS
jgi:6,7-dimethyl-8-ribityllumazine synthase